MAVVKEVEKKIVRFKTKDPKLSEKAQAAGCHPVEVKNVNIGRKAGKEVTFVETAEQVEKAIAKLDAELAKQEG